MSKWKTQENSQQAKLRRKKRERSLNNPRLKPHKSTVYLSLIFFFFYTYFKTHSFWNITSEVISLDQQVSLLTTAQMARGQPVCRSVRQRGGYAGKRRDWSHPQQFIFLPVWLEGVCCYWVWDHCCFKCVRKTEDRSFRDDQSASKYFIVSYINIMYYYINMCNTTPVYQCAI